MNLIKYDRIKAEGALCAYTGVVAEVSNTKALILRDDGIQGSGRYLEGYGRGWAVAKDLDGVWRADGNVGGVLEVIK